MDELLAHFEQAKNQYLTQSKYSIHNITFINPPWRLLVCYYTITDMLPAMHGVITLLPDMNLK
jgi:hypothetical protein